MCKIRNPDSFCPCIEELTYCMIDFYALEYWADQCKRKTYVGAMCTKPKPHCFCMIGFSFYPFTHYVYFSYPCNIYHYIRVI
jgi:hypothetical protein